MLFSSPCEFLVVLFPLRDFHMVGVAAAAALTFGVATAKTRAKNGTSVREKDLNWHVRWLAIWNSLTALRTRSIILFRQLQIAWPSFHKVPQTNI